MLVDLSLWGGEEVVSIRCQGLRDEGEFGLRICLASLHPLFARHGGSLDVVCSISSTLRLRMFEDFLELGILFVNRRACQGIPRSDKGLWDGVLFSNEEKEDTSLPSWRHQDCE